MKSWNQLHCIMQYHLASLIGCYKCLATTRQLTCNGLWQWLAVRFGAITLRIFSRKCTSLVIIIIIIIIIFAAWCSSVVWCNAVNVQMDVVWMFYGIIMRGNPGSVEDEPALLMFCGITLQVDVGGWGRWQAVIRSCSSSSRITFTPPYGCTDSRLAHL